MTSDEIAINSINETTLALSNQHAAIEKVMADPSSDVKMLMLGPYVLYMHKKERKVKSQGQDNNYKIYKSGDVHSTIVCGAWIVCGACMALFALGLLAITFIIAFASQTQNSDKVSVSQQNSDTNICTEYPGLEKVFDENALSKIKQGKIKVERGKFKVEQIAGDSSSATYIVSLGDDYELEVVVY